MKDKKVSRKTAILASLFLSLCLCENSLAQQHLIQRPENYWLQLAEQQYANKHYALAAQSAQHYLSLKDKRDYSQSHDAFITAKYYQTLAAIKLKRDGAEDSAIRFTAAATNPDYTQRVSFALAQYYFEQQQYQKAVPYYEKVNLANLNNAEIADLKFELAYAYFNNKEFDKAMPLFAVVDGLNGRYKNAGSYYYGLLAYNNGKYEEALNSFKKIDNDPKYKNLVSFYEAEILYFTGKRKEALEQVFALTKGKEKNYYDNELHLLAAQILFEEKRYGDALPYFEHYYDNVDKIRKEELYEMAYSYYRVEEWKNAIDKFKPLSGSDDSLGQTAMYLLGDSYLKTGNKTNARNAFSICSGMSFNKQQQEASLLMHSKLSYELGYYDDAIASVKTLLNQFPQTKYKGEAFTILSELLLRTNNYEEAYASLSEANEQSPNYADVYQKVTYGYAMQQLQQGNNLFADSLLSLSLRYPVNASYISAAKFWKGEIAYNAGNYQKAYDYSQQFIAANDENASLISDKATLANANMNLGYAAMELKDYKNAQIYFSKAQAEGGSTDIAGTALLREADAYFLQKNYKEAASLYDKVIKANGAEADYGRLQQAIIAGVNNNTEEKIKILNQLISQKPASSYATQARYELGVTYIEDDKYQAAITTLQPILEDNTGREYAVKAWMKTAFAYQQLNKDDKAIEAYKHIVVSYPSSDEKEDAVNALRNLYVENGKPDAYAAFISENNIATNKEATLDSTYYAVAENYIAASKWKEAKNSLANYLANYPNGSFTTRAHYYLAESNRQLKDNDSALKEYDAVLNLPWNEFSENSAKSAATLAYNKQDYAAAANYYEKLRNTALGNSNLQTAYTGLMRSAYNQQKYELAAAYADTLISLPEVDKTLSEEVLFYKAKSLQQQNANNEALALYTQLQQTKNTTIADEVNYRIAEINFAKGDLKEAEKQAAENVKSSSGNNYWVVKSYILLADVLIRQKDYFNAKATLQSIIKNTKFDDLKKEAETKLNEVKQSEKEQSKLSAG